MKTLLTLYDKDIFPKPETYTVATWRDRITGKVIILDEFKKIALIKNNVHNYLLLPGGGIEENEDIIQGTIRECAEETGYKIVIETELGITDDYRAKESKHCINYGYIGNIVEKGEPNLTESEKDIGVSVVWIPLTEAVILFEKQVESLKEGTIKYYNTGFNVVRDCFFVKKAFEILK